MPQRDEARHAAVGVIGLGSLGLPIARNLLARGFVVVGHQRRGTEALAAAGGAGVQSVPDVAARCARIVTCLPNADALADVVERLLPALVPGDLVLDLGTLPLAAKQAARVQLARAGARMLDCAVSGNHRYLETRSAAIFASGDADDFERGHDVLRAITDHVTFVGPFGAGLTMKLIASVLVPLHTLAAAEALALASRAGLDPRRVVDALRGTQASSAMLETRGARMADEHFDGPPLSGYHRRNVEPTLALARRVGGRYPLLHALDACYRDAIAAGYGDLDQEGVYAFLRAEER